MAYNAKILLDSISLTGQRLTTMEVAYPRFVHSEFMTHRMFSRNAASSRAIPIAKMIKAVQDDPVMPVWWGKNQAGMQAKEELEGIEGKIRFRDKDRYFLESGGILSKNYKRNICEYEWLKARDEAVLFAQILTKQDLHKQIVNRLLEPWMWITVIVSATEWNNFFALRCHPDAQPELRHIAEMMRDLYESSTPTRRLIHTPLVEDIDINQLYDAGYRITHVMKVSVGRCARVSYLTHSGKRDPQEDIKLHDRLLESGHWSPFEHVATSMIKPDWSGNFFGWNQYRKQFPNECAQ